MIQEEGPIIELKTSGCRIARPHRGTEQSENGRESRNTGVLVVYFVAEEG